jgi:hypothetical protein
MQPQSRVTFVMETSNGANEIFQPVEPARQDQAQRPAQHRIAVATGRFYLFVRDQLFSVMKPPSIG